MLNPKELFYCKNKDTYPPFKNGLYLEEYFINRYFKEFKENTDTSRKYIPLPWTNFQLEPWFNQHKNYLQKQLDEWVDNNPSEKGYFTVVQYDDGPQLKLPKNTIVFGACGGDIPIPLIYEDKNKVLESKKVEKKFNDKNILCSFVGTTTHDVRRKVINELKNNKNFVFNFINGWSPVVDINKQSNFINISNLSKFGLAPRGYGRSSFRFYELFTLGTIPVYVWDDIEWLPYKEIIDYSKFCISINIKDINKLDNILRNISEDKYYEMWNEYQKIKHYFTLEGMYDYIINKINTPPPSPPIN
jgi:hypothetical protein